MARKDGRPKFTPDLSTGAPTTAEEQERDHNDYYDRQHDVELAKKLKDSLTNKGLELISDSGGATKALLEVIRELRLTQE